MADITYGTSAGLAPEELAEFYQRLGHEIAARPEQIQRMLESSAVFVTARDGDRLIGVARGLGDGLRGYLTECKLDPDYQGAAAVTRKDGRVEHDQHGIAARMAGQVLDALRQAGVQRIDVLAWGTEVDFCQELGFKRSGGLVGLTLPDPARPEPQRSPASLG